MAMRIWEPTLVLGLASAMALAAAAPSFGQTQQRQGARTQAQQGVAVAPADETTGQSAPRTQSPARGAQQGAAQQQCWIPTNDDMGFGYYGPCSGPRARPVK